MFPLLRQRIVPVLFLFFIAAAPAPKPTFSTSIHEEINKSLDDLQSTGDFSAAEKQLEQLFDQTIAHALPKDLDVLRESDFALRLIRQLKTLQQSTRLELLKYLRANDTLAHTLVFLIHPKQDPSSVYKLLDHLRESRGEQLDKFASLAAAICVVHDRPLDRHINENSVKAPDPIALFDFYTKNESRLFFGLKNVPAELLIFVVDSTAQIDEMNWALANFAGDPKVGGRFFDIKYDWQHYRHGTEKRITTDGFNLPNIQRYGGVCADQAYFAASVGKSIGVPTAYTHGAAATAGHAWVGFLEATAKQGWWNFDIGRYEAYRGVRGWVLDPQLRVEIPDSYVSLLAEMIGTKTADGHNAAALADAAARLIEAENNFNPPAPAIAAGALTKPRKADLNSQLELLELAVKQNPADRRSWLLVGQLAKDGKLPLDAKKKWADMVQRLCGAKYPDFALAILTPMIQTIDDVKEQNKLWNSAFEMFKTRSDLAAFIRMSQAAMWEQHNDINNAGKCYEDVIGRFANAGPFVIEALKKAEAALRESKRADKVPLLYEQTWLKIDRPKEINSPFIVQSNWYRVGEMFAARLDESGERGKADSIRNLLSAPTPTATDGRR